MSATDLAHDDDDDGNGNKNIILLSSFLFLETC